MRIPQPLQSVERRIFLVRGRKVLLGGDLATLYGVAPKALGQAIRRNRDRFPEDFMFRLRWNEVAALRPLLPAAEDRAGARSRSQTVTLKRGRNLKYLPYAFTEEGVAMLSGVLRSRRAVRVNVAIMRAFVRRREIFGAHRDLARRLDGLERKTDPRFRAVFDAIRGLGAPPRSAAPPDRVPRARARWRRARESPTAVVATRPPLEAVDLRISSGDRAGVARRPVATPTQAGDRRRDARHGRLGTPSPPRRREGPRPEVAAVYSTFGSASIASASASA